MIKDGLPDEVRKLLSDGVRQDAQSMQAIGYKEMIPYIRGEYSLDTAADLIRRGTRHYAKRQITFIKRLREVCHVDPFQDQALKKIENIMKGINDEDLCQ